MKRFVYALVFVTMQVQAMFIPAYIKHVDVETVIPVPLVRGNESIEPYQAGRDFPVVAAIIKEYAKFLIHHQTLERLLAILEQVSVPTIAVYRVADVTVGFVNLVVAERSFLWYTKRYAVIAGIGVASAYQGKGYGNVLLDYAIDRCMNHLNVATLELEVHRENQKALSWYQSKGFVVASYGADGWISCVLNLVTDKSQRQTIASRFDNIIECLAG